MGANTFAGGTLDRVGEHRADEDWVRARLTDPAARAVVVGREGVLVADGDEPAAARCRRRWTTRRRCSASRAHADLRDRPRRDRPPAGDARCRAARDLGGNAGRRRRAARLRHRAHRVAAALAVLRRLRLAQPPGGGRPPHGLHRPRSPAPSADRPGDHRARHRRGGPRAHGPPGDLAGEALVVPRRVRRAGRVARGGRRARGRRGVRRRRLRRDLHLQPAVAVPREPHARLPRDVRGGEPTTRDAELEAVRWFSREEIVTAHAAPDIPWTPEQREPPAGIDFWLPPREAIARQLVAAWAER